MAGRPKTTSSLADQEMNKLEKQFDTFDENVKQLTQDRMNQSPLKETEPQTKMSSKDLQNSKDIYLKPDRSISSREKFNDKWRNEYEFSKEYVNFVAENKEIIGETIEMWTKPYPGMPAEFWKVPVNKPVWGPRYLAEAIANRKYHRLVMQQNTITSADGMGQYYGSLAVDTTINRLEAHPVSPKKSIFMGANNF